MIPYNQQPVSSKKIGNVQIEAFEIDNENIDIVTVESFGEEWSKFDSFSEAEIEQVGNDYFDIVTKTMLNDSSVVLDMGCGTGRWTKYAASKAKFVEAVDPSIAVYSAANLIGSLPNVRISQASVSNLPFADNSFDLVFSLGVLHHIPDTAAAMKSCVAKVKPGGYFLVYLYYSLDNRSTPFKMLFKASNVIRGGISELSPKPKKFVCDFIAYSVYMPFVGLTKLVRGLGMKNLSKKIPLSYYHDKSINIIRNDALDRFGTPLEQRFSKVEIKNMMESCGLTDIIFSENEPYWHAVGRKK